MLMLSFATSSAVMSIPILMLESQSINWYWYLLGYIIAVLLNLIYHIIEYYEQKVSSTHERKKTFKQLIKSKKLTIKSNLKIGGMKINNFGK